MSYRRDNFFGYGSVVVLPDGDGDVRRLAIEADRLVTQPFEGIEVIPDVISWAARLYNDRDAFGWRDILDIHEEEKDVEKVVNGQKVVEKKKWRYFRLGDYKYISFHEFRERVLALARGLLHHELQKTDVFSIYAQTSVNWQLMSHACSMIATPVATTRDILGEADLKHSLNEPECIGIFTNAEHLPTLARVIKDTPSIRLVVYDGETRRPLLDQIRGVREDIVVVSIDELWATGRQLPLDILESRRPTPDDLALIMYTSGSTGAPKGVMLTHGNVMASIGGVRYLIRHHMHEDDRYLAYLPLAHIMEYMVEVSLFLVGVKIGYGRLETLTDASVRRCKGDLASFRPTILVGEPSFWVRIHKNILEKMSTSGGVRKSIFNGVMAVKKAAVLSGVRGATGGHLRLAMSGGGPLSRETQQFFSEAMVTLLQGYGLTESCAVCALLPPELMQYDAAGLPVPCIEIKLVDVPEAGYNARGCPPQGEICIRGPAVTKEYYKRPDLNFDETVFTKNGWFRTRDVGQWNPDGTLSLIGRIDNDEPAILQGGESIVLGRLEATYKSCSLVSNICMHASTEAKQPIGIIIPHETSLRRVLIQRLLPGVDSTAPLADLCRNSAVRRLVLKECNAVGKENGFKPKELLEAVILTEDEWTLENGLLTLWQKVWRSRVVKRFEPAMKTIYKNW